MDKRYQIFVSSTFADLQQERQAVMQGLLSLDHFPAGMELFPASDEDQWALIKGVIDDSDYYVLVIGGRYGSTTEDGISYTEMEFEYAKATKKPILAFIHQNPDLIPAGRTDLSDAARVKLEAFRSKVGTGRHIKFWANADDLRAKVIQSISAETKRNLKKVGFDQDGRSIQRGLSLYEPKSTVFVQSSQIPDRRLRPDLRTMQAERTSIRSTACTKYTIERKVNG